LYGHQSFQIMKAEQGQYRLEPITRIISRLKISLNVSSKISLHTPFLYSFVFAICRPTKLQVLLWRDIIKNFVILLGIYTIGTYKYRKIYLQNDGFDLKKCQPDAVYFLDRNMDGYRKLDQDLYESIMRQKLEL